MRIAIPVLLVAAMTGCGHDAQHAATSPDVLGQYQPVTITPEPKVAPLAAHWISPVTTDIGREWRYVRDSDGRFMAEVSQYDSDKTVYTVWHNGAGYGDYGSLESAKAQAEKVAQELGEKTR